MSGRLKSWFFLFRPWSYTATAVPFLFALAWCVSGGGRHAGFACDFVRWGAGFAAGILFQATVNLLNTWGDERSGVDAVPGAIRTTPQIHDGLVSMRALLAAALGCAFAASALGTALCFFRIGGAWHVNAPLLALGFVGFLGATNYSTGVRFKYRGLGVPFVALLMGPVETAVALALLFPKGALAWTCWPLRMQLASAGIFLLLTFPIAALVCVIMHGNDMRDVPTDRAAGIKTLASMLGPRGALRFYAFCHYAAYAAPALLAWTVASFMLRSAYPEWKFAALACAPFCVLPISAKSVRRARDAFLENSRCPPWRGFERESGKIHLLFGLCYAVAWAATRAALSR